MSRIKFRVWSDELKHYIDSLDKPEVYIRSDGTPFFNDGVATINDLEPLKIEQYTGLTDRKGQMICEGDILESSKYRSVVKYDGGGFYASVIGSGQTFDMPGEWQRSIMIGNVHENPELLEADK